jgi:hypothetical protein
VEVEWTVGPIPVNDDLGVRSASCLALRVCWYLLPDSQTTM